MANARRDGYPVGLWVMWGVLLLAILGVILYAPLISCPCQGKTLGFDVQCGMCFGRERASLINTWRSRSEVAKQLNGY
jgi:uncharacterized RDD family membrane protein YckC